MAIIIDSFKFDSNNTFVMEVDTTITGISASNQFTLYLQSGTYDYTVYWGDGNQDSYTDSTNRTHTYSTGGVYEIQIEGTAFAGFYYNDNNEAHKITSFKVLGDLPFTNFSRAFYGANNALMQATDPGNFTGVSDFTNAWRGCSSLTSFPLIDISSVTALVFTWFGCNSLTSFPLLDTSSITNFSYAWSGCSSLTSFPLINTSNGLNFSYAWNNNSSLTSFPLIDTSSGTNLGSAWFGCSSLTSFPLIDTSSGTNFFSTWRFCSSLTSFPLLNTSSGLDFSFAWGNCSSLTSFPLLDTSSGTNFNQAWRFCSSLTSFPALNLSSGTSFDYTWSGCSSLTSFPANMFDTCLATIFSGAFTNTNLSQTSIDNILVSINTANTSNGTFNQSGGSAPSATGEAAIDSLRSRGWTVTVTGGY